MKPILLTILALGVTTTLHAKPAPTPAPVPAAPTPAAADDDSAAGPEARSAALELAGAFSNDGYKIRDGYYFGAIEPGQGAVIEVNLFAGNEYWFCAAANDPAHKISVKVYNEDGVLVKEQQAYDDGAKAAAGIVADTSGKYLVKISLVEGEKSQFCFLYCYK